MELHIEGQHTEVAPDLQSWIAEHVEALDAPSHDILHARITLVKNERHRRGSDEARVLLTLSGKTLSATRTGDTLEDALYGVMEMIKRELHDFREIRRGIVKEPGPRPRGHIVRIFHDRGYGFIETESHQEVYFHAHSVEGIPFERLHVDMVVDLDIESGNRGPQASRVTPRLLHSPGPIQS
jgi:cold shock CspA family protein/ribosome-associated translation inhibitor RaiA